MIKEVDHYTVFMQIKLQKLRGAVFYPKQVIRQKHGFYVTKN